MDASLKSLRMEVAKMRKELANLSTTSEKFAQKAERLKEIDSHIQGLSKTATKRLSIK